MSLIAKCVVWMFLTMFLVSRVEAAPVCLTAADAYELALAETQGTADGVWLDKLDAGDCAEVPEARYMWTLSRYKSDTPSRVAKYLLWGKNVYGLISDLPRGTWMVRYDPEWETRPPEIRKWFQSLMQPDFPKSSCCGEADAYEADIFEVEGDHYVAIITGQGPETIGKPYLKEGTRIPVPNHKMKWDQGNPTGHGILFLSTSGAVYCYVTPGGV